MQAYVITQDMTGKPVVKPSAHSQSAATFQSLCSAFLSLEDGFRRLSAHRLDGCATGQSVGLQLAVALLLL